jgi:sestrin
MGYHVFIVFQVHVNLMILEARMQAELLYALRAVMRYMT